MLLVLSYKKHKDHCCYFKSCCLKNYNFIKLELLIFRKYLLYKHLWISCLIEGDRLAKNCLRLPAPANDSSSATICSGSLPDSLLRRNRKFRRLATDDVAFVDRRIFSSELGSGHHGHCLRQKVHFNFGRILLYFSPSFIFVKI